MTPTPSMDTIVSRFVAWAEPRADIRAAAIVGSRARTDRPADEWSDLDLVVVVDEPQRYLGHTAWLGEIGEPRLTFLEATAVGGLTERRVLFAGGHDVDFSFVPAALIQQWHGQEIPGEVAGVLQRGIRILFDKDTYLTRQHAAVAARPARAIAPPSPEAVAEVVNDFLYHALWCAKKLRRGELWIAKQGCDCGLKALLLRMIAWHAQAESNWRLDTWHGGRFLDQWAGPDVRLALPDTFAAYTPHEVRRALLATLALFRRLSTAVAAHVGYTYPNEAHAEIQAWIEQHSAA